MAGLSEWNWHPVDKELVVWLTEWRTYGFILYRGAHMSTVSFTNPETEERVVEQVENDEYYYWGEQPIHDEYGT